MITIRVLGKEFSTYHDAIGYVHDYYHANLPKAPVDYPMNTWYEMSVENRGGYWHIRVSWAVPTFKTPYGNNLTLFYDETLKQYGFPRCAVPGTHAAWRPRDIIVIMQRVDKDEDPVI